MATISGGEVRIFLSADGGTTYKAFASETECSFEMNAETREVTSKDVAVFRSYVTSAKTWSVTGTMLLATTTLLTGIPTSFTARWAT
jgi:predicted secreted protein